MLVKDTELFRNYRHIFTDHEALLSYKINS